MRANKVSPDTITAYGGALRQFGLWLLDGRYASDPEAIERRHVEDWISILEHRKPATAQPLTRAAAVLQSVSDEG